MGHRSRVGGLWNEIGELQFNFMVERGLEPHHRLLDIGCGCLRGGVRFIEYLNSGNYYGIDKDASLLEAGKKEAQLAGLNNKQFNLMFTSNFDFAITESNFDFAIAQSVFTHINLNEIILCLINLERVLVASGKFFATYFHASKDGYKGIIERQTTDGKIVATLPAFSRSMHYTLEMLQFAGAQAGLKCEPVSDDLWDHPRRQKMVVFYR